MQQTWEPSSITKHLDDLSKEDLLETIIKLGSEGKNVINILNQRTLANKLKGEFVGDKVDDYDILVNRNNNKEQFRIELKCNVNQATDEGETVGFGSFLQKINWNMLIHYTPFAFNSYLKEDQFVVFAKSDLPELKKYCNKSGGIRWTHKIFNKNHKITNAGGHGEKLWFIKDRIMNFEQLYELIHNTDLTKFNWPPCF